MYRVVFIHHTACVCKTVVQSTDKGLIHGQQEYNECTEGEEGGS